MTALHINVARETSSLDESSDNLEDALEQHGEFLNRRELGLVLTGRIDRVLVETNREGQRGRGRSESDIDGRVCDGAFHRTDTGGRRAEWIRWLMTDFGLGLLMDRIWLSW